MKPQQNSCNMRWFVSDFSCPLEVISVKPFSGAFVAHWSSHCQVQLARTDRPTSSLFFQILAFWDFRFMRLWTVNQTGVHLVPVVCVL